MLKLKAVVALATLASAAIAANVGESVSTAPRAVESPRATPSALIATPVREAVARPVVAQPTIGRPTAVIPVRTGTDQWMWIVPAVAGSGPAAPEGAADVLVEV
ncbi:hypothetical protein ABZ622_35770 [Streptomyces sp. NPDC007164]|uniref:hypothetical protein n=1 Tax=Streptomyces sp. NPDC007164 TaxID=3156918 RepID=UPI003400BB26